VQFNPPARTDPRCDKRAERSFAANQSLALQRIQGARDGDPADGELGPEVLLGSEQRSWGALPRENPRLEHVNDLKVERNRLRAREPNLNWVWLKDHVLGARGSATAHRTMVVDGLVVTQMRNTRVQ
jgi:hypothetical protein